MLKDLRHLRALQQAVARSKMTAYNGLHNREDMIGLRFNKWTVLEHSPKKNRSGNWFYLCRCDCGNTGVVQGSKLRTQKTTQCKKCSAKLNGRKGLYAKNAETDLYVIKSGEHYYKIGTTLNIEERLRTIKSNNPEDISCVYYGKGRGHEEEFWHKYFKKHHWEGEWYVFNDEQATKAIEEITAGGCEI